MSAERSEPNKQRAPAWNAGLYDQKHAFVWKYGAELISLLAPQAGERILDLGCGTGHLTARIAEVGAAVVGVDRSEEMLQTARKTYPHLRFEAIDARNLPFAAEFDAVFSNATLHWIPEAELVIQNVWRALRPNGRFVAEFGGQGNTRKVMCALKTALAERNAAGAGEVSPFYYPSVSEYSGLLEKGGFEVTQMTLFDRPTPLNDGDAGVRNWITMFCAAYFERLTPEARETFFRRVEDLLRPDLWRDGQWRVDYRRLRFAAHKL